MSISDEIISFLKSHPLISVAGLEKQLDIPDSTIRQATTGAREIPHKHLFPVVSLLAGYGLKYDGYDLSYDPNDGVLSGRRFVENMETIEVNDQDGTNFEYIVKEYRSLWTNSDDFI